MNKNKYFDLGLLLVGLALVFLMSCASVKPMNYEAMEILGVFRDGGVNFENLKNFQYFVSRDFVLTITAVDTQTDVSRGRAFQSTTEHRDNIELVASLPGKCLDYYFDYDSDYLMLGIEFDPGSNDLLWFYYDLDDDFFYLEYTNRARQEIEYAGITYKVSYEQATGLDAIGATVQRLLTIKKADESYQNMEPLLLYEGTDTRRVTESRRTLRGSRL